MGSSRLQDLESRAPMQHSQATSNVGPPGLEASKEEVSSDTPTFGGPPAEREVDEADEVDEEQRIEPETGKAFTFKDFEAEFSKTYKPDEIRDYWRDACKVVPKKPRADRVENKQSSAATERVTKPPATFQPA